MKDLWTTLKEAKKPIVLYGMGNGADKVIDICNAKGIKVSGVFASDGFVREKIFRSFPVTNYETAKKQFGDMIVLLCFATSLSGVIDNILRIALEQELYVPDVPVYGETLFDCAFVSQHEKELNEVHNLLCDEESKRLFDGIVQAKLTGSLPLLLSSVSEDYDGFLTLLHPQSYRLSADLGAFTGDTAQRLSSFAPGIETIVCMEPDPKTFARLQKSCKDSPWAELHPSAAWDKEETLDFRIGGSRSSRLSGEGKTAKVRAMPLDAILDGRKCDFIKYDVEGADLPALLGSEKTILDSRPEMLLSLYHRSEDLFVLPLALHKICPEYDFYLRRAASLPAWDLNLIALPRK